MAVSPWTMVLNTWLDCKDKRRNEDQQRCQDESPSSLREKITTKADSNDGGKNILSIRNLPESPLRKPSILSIEEDELQEHHKYKLFFIWGISLVCGLCSEQVMDQSKNPPCSLVRRISSPVEIVSILLTLPLPALLIVSAWMISFYLSPHLLSRHHGASINILIFILLIITILPSLLAEFMDTGSNLSIIIFFKFIPASLHTIFEPVVMLCMRQDLVHAIRNMWTTARK